MSLRDRKKLETRQRISDEATMLFLARGFEAVTVAEIADAANVSRMTVFNYFPRKEDLLFDRVPEMHEMLLGAVTDRPAGTTPVHAVRDRLLELIAQGHPLGGAGDHRKFWRTVLDSPALRARIREAIEELEGALAEVLLPTEGPARAHWTAVLILSAVRTTWQIAAHRIFAGEDPDLVLAEQPALVAELFTGVERALSAR
ncbi:TetR/AcrR family transcriptional regulator [Cryptosporangium sp. NPDC048952]|uniref:TetR/AcrR family transcriptional regulator n=1 Tax=Cryptosporangium sp. NPDC048952 TaxID=3363961 RepID=UPI003722DB25